MTMTPHAARKSKGVSIIDCQMRTEHLLSLGAREIPRTAYLKILQKELS